ncbi:MAG: hypothetical protein IPG81_14965 [Sandaracinaceae bacterium]|nr:hypothetical protein [Sandaracinaceae bacterium]
MPSPCARSYSTKATNPTASSWQKGIALFFRGKVDVLEEYEDEVHP